MKKDKEFLNVILKGDIQIIELLKEDKQLKNIKDEKGYNIIHYLIAGNQSALTKILLSKKLITYTTVLKTIHALIKTKDYKNDNYYDFVNILKPEDKEKMICKSIENIIQNNNIKTLKEVEVEKVIEYVEIMKIDFLIFAKCNDDMIETCLPIYKSLTFDMINLKLGFYELKLNKIRTSMLMENLNMIISPYLYEQLKAVNEYCVTYLENRELYNKLEKNLLKNNNNNHKNKSLKI